MAVDPELLAILVCPKTKGSLQVVELPAEWREKLVQKYREHFHDEEPVVEEGLYCAESQLVYPIVGYALGHGWPESPLFGMAPCPTVITLFGVLALARARPRHLFVLPIVWTLLATGPAVERGAWEDVGMVGFGAAAVAATVTGPGLTGAPSSRPPAGRSASK